MDKHLDAHLRGALARIDEAQSVVDSAALDLGVIKGFGEERKRLLRVLSELCEIWDAVDKRRQSFKKGGLELREEEDGPRYYLEGRPVHAGDLLEVLHDDVADWLVVRFEWSCVLDDPVRFFTEAGEVQVPTTARFRWPSD